MSEFQKNIDNIVDTINLAKRINVCCGLLIGAGCSAKAGIPTASGFVDIFRNTAEYLPFYNKAKDKTYVGCMKELSLAEQKELIREKG